MKINCFSSFFPKNKIKIDQQFAHFSNFKLAKKRSGVNQKFVANKNETALDLAYNAFNKIEEKSIIEELELIVFITQTPDYLLPGNSFLLIEKLGLSKKVICYDINQACSGFIYGTLIIEQFMKSKTINKAALICSDTYSKLIDENDRGTSLLFGDAASITFFNNSLGVYNVVASKVENHSKYNNLFIVKKSGARDNFNSSNPIIEMNGMHLLNLITLVAPIFIENFLKEQSLKKNDINKFIFHQASQVALESLQKILSVPSSKIYSTLNNTGNTTCASIPITLEEMIKTYKNNLPEKVLVFGFGVGFSIGCVLLNLNKD